MSSTEMSMNPFLKILWDVVHEKSVYIKTQQPRLESLLEEYWRGVSFKVPQIQSISLEKDDFVNNLQYRSQTIRKLQHAMEDGYRVVKAIVDYFFLDYIGKQEIKQDFPPKESINAQYRIVEDLLGSLLQFVVLDKTPIPLEYVIVAKFKSLLKIKALPIQRMVDGLEKDNIALSPEDVEKSLKNLVNLGFVEEVEDPKSNQTAFRFVGDFALNPESEKIYIKKIKQIIEWAVGLWRTLYNIRSLNTPIPDAYPEKQFLEETVSRAATQGYVYAHNVMENLADYFDHIIQSDGTCP